MTSSANAGSTALITERGEGRRIYVLGAEITVKISSRDTNRAFAVFEGTTGPLQGPPLHLHREQDEWWYIIEGEFRFEVDGQEIHARTGDTVFAPRGSRHTFQNMGITPGRMLGTFVPGGLDIFFEEIEAAAPRGAVPDFAKLVPIFGKHGQEMLGPPLAARPVGNASRAD
jgi:mannose-6-phosphate isomerase-like protein (cupin superfamily)